MTKQKLLASDLMLSPILAFDIGAAMPFTYSPYGHRAALGDAPACGFTGQLRERAQGWYLLGNGHRIYSPTLMRFYSPDRLSPFDKGGWNSYCYCAGDPVNRHDRSGRQNFTLSKVFTSSYSNLQRSGDMLNVGTLVTNAFLAWKSRSLSQKFTRSSVTAITVTAIGAGMNIYGRVLERGGMEGTGTHLQAIGNDFMLVGSIIATVDVNRAMTANARNLEPSGNDAQQLNSSSSSLLRGQHNVHGGMGLVTSPRVRDDTSDPLLAQVQNNGDNAELNKNVREAP